MTTQSPCKILWTPITGAISTATAPRAFIVWATVMSRPTDDRALVDPGVKALASDAGAPLVGDEPAATSERASDEHGRLGVSGATNRLQIGDEIRLVPAIATRSCSSHCGSKQAEFGSHGPDRSPLRDTCRPGPGRLVKTYREALKPFEQKRLLTYQRCVATLAARPRKAPARVFGPHHPGRECSARRGSPRIGDCKKPIGITARSSRNTISAMRAETMPMPC